MSYKILSLKWRPQIFKDIIGQDHITQTIVNALKQNRIAQGYLFTGPRGVGKTTTARILSMALNSPDGPAADFDPDTEIAREIADGRALDVLEIDGASNRGIDEIRRLREQIKFAPMNCSYKVIIIDEVHMLTTPAFNALLRTLEEPPAHGKFIFCTTDVHKVPATIISRCQRFDFNRISLQVISDRLKSVVKAENIIIEKESLASISRKADGSMRDALSLLDQVISFCGSSVLHEDVVIALGLIPQDLYFDFTRSIREKNNELMIKLLSKFTSFGISAAEVLNGIGEHIRNLLYAGVKNGQELLEMNQEYRKLYVQESAEWDKRDLIRVGQALGDVSAYIRQAEDPYLLLEMTAFKLLELDRSISIDQLLSGDLPVPSSTKNTILPPTNTADEKSTYSKPVDAFDQHMIGKDIKSAKLDTKAGKSDEQKSRDESIPGKTSGLQSEKKKIGHENDDDSNISLQDIETAWPNVLVDILTKRPSIGTILENSKPIDYDGQIITIQSSSQSEFNLKMVEKHAKIVEEIISVKIGRGLRIRLIQGKGDAQGTNDTKGEKSEKKLNTDDKKTLNRIVELFDGEILR